MTSPVKTIAIVAGEASGDLLGSMLMTAIREAGPNVRFIGIGGPKMQAVGMNVLFPLEKLAVNGYLEVLRHYRELVGIRRSLRARFLAEPPDLFIGIDAPDFNLDLELALKQHGIPTVHYVSPSIWAWRGERIHKIKRAVSHLLALFPFEPPLYEKVGVPVSYVGHPLADLLPLQPRRSEMREQMHIPPDARVYALLPGSRQSEVRRLAATFIETARLILQQQPGARFNETHCVRFKETHCVRFKETHCVRFKETHCVRFLVPLASRETRDIFEHALWQLDAQQLPFTLLFGHAHDAMVAADGVLVASGTATLEAALLKRPMVITYKLSPFSYWLARRRQYLPYVGLPNILAGRFVVPEILQDDATPQNLAQALLNAVNTRQAVSRLEACFDGIHRSLRQNTAERAAQAILPFLA